MTGLAPIRVRHFATTHIPTSSFENRQKTSPDVPPTSSAGEHESRDYYVGQNAPQPPPNQAPYLTPYLGLRARLSQIWINRWTILLLLVLVRTLFALATIDDGLDSARAKAISACQDAERLGSALASTPHYLSRGLNSMTSNGIERAVNGLMSMVNLMVTGIEEIVVFVIGMMTNTYLCLITLVVRGSMTAALNLLKKGNDALKKLTENLGDELGDGIKVVQDAINKVSGGLGGLIPGDLPKLDLTKQIDSVRALELPGDLTDDLAKLNRSIPTFDQVKNATETVIRLPFEELKKLISKEMGTYTFNGSLLPVAAKDSISICSGPDSVGINEVFDDLVHVAKVARTVFLVVLILAAILVMAPIAWLEIKKWRRQQERAKLMGDESMDNMDAVYITSRPTSSRAGIWLSKKFRSTRAQVLARWAIAYPTSTPALFVLSLAAAGLFACLCQYILLKSIENESPAITKQMAAGAGKLAATLNNASNAWSIATNRAIDNETLRINEDLFGWVNVSTTAVNNTLNTFVDEVHQVAQDFLGGTMLQQPLEDLFRCLIGLKIEAFQKGLTWVKENANVNFPHVKNDTLSLAALADMTDSNSDDQLLNDPTGTAQRAIDNAVKSLIRKLMAGIRQEAIISTMILVIWLLLVLIGIVRAYLAYVKGDKVRGAGGNEYDFSDRTPNPQKQFRPESAAPPYVFPDSDVNPHAPYTLAHHPFPSQNRSVPDSHIEKVAPQSSSGNPNFSRPSTSRSTDPAPGEYWNEKSSNNPFVDQNRI